MVNTYVMYSSNMDGFGGYPGNEPGFILIPPSGAALSLMRIDISWNSIDSTLAYDEAQINILPRTGAYDSSGATGGPYSAISMNDTSPSPGTIVYLDGSEGAPYPPIYFCSFSHGNSLKTLDFANIGGWTVSDGNYLHIPMYAPDISGISVALYFQEPS